MRKSYEMEPGILPVRIGGLGNQLFVVVAAYITAKIRGVPLYIQDMVCDAHQTVKEDYSESIFSFCRRITADPTYPTFSPDGFSPWSPYEVRPGTAMASYFQYYPVLAPYEDELRALILSGLYSYRTALGRGRGEGCAFLHVRRGDYLKIPHIHYVQPIDYYVRAVDRFPPHVKILLFSDDMEWVESQEFFRGERFELVRGDELENLALMTLCTEGAICSNSTFSWWGAFLGPHSRRSPVVVPARWINPDYVNSEKWRTAYGMKVPPLFPEDWIILP
jgi:hypothetical protein